MHDIEKVKADIAAVQQRQEELAAQAAAARHGKEDSVRMRRGMGEVREGEGGCVWETAGAPP